MGEEGPCISIIFLLPLLVNCPFEETFAYDSPLLGLLDAIAGIYKYPPAFYKILMLFLYLMIFLLGSPFVSFCGGLSFLLPPGR